ncbi:MAG: hypothetical protein HUJ61_03665 [Bacilli bacterium]|nr:hypothetical protein [Bacilli bacterium]
MAKESLIFKRTSNFENDIKNNECFGWELQSVTDIVVMLRETKDPNYGKLVEGEKEYNELIEQKETIDARYIVPHRPLPTSTWLFVILLILGIIPGIIYKAVKNNTIAKYETLLAEINRQKENECIEITRKIDAVLSDCHNIHFFR